MDCVCPRPAAIATVLRVTCTENIGQVQRAAFQRGGFEFDANADPVTTITLLASWTPLLTAVNSTKLVITPYLENFVIPQAEAITRGGNDNTTLNGVEQVVGYGGITVTANLTGVPVSIIDALRDLMCEPDIVVYLFNQYGKIVCRELDPDDNPGDVYGGIPIEPNTLGVPYPGNNGFATLDEATMRFGLSADWAQNRAIIEPDFNLKTDLVAPVA